MKITSSSGWFDFQGPYAVLKPEHRGDFLDAVNRQKERDAAALETLRAETRAREPVKLTEEQKGELSGKYDPRNMTKEDYMDFVDDLCGYGLFDPADRAYVQANELNLIPLDFADTGAGMTAADLPLYGGFDTCGGNVLDWARYHASFTSYSEVTMDYEPTRGAILFGKIAAVLGQLE